jgi:hypothetical protein
VAADTGPGAYPSALIPKSSSGISAPASAICWISGLSSMSMSGSVFDDACCSTFWISVGPGTDWWSTVASPIEVPHFCSWASMLDLPGSSV